MSEKEKVVKEAKEDSVLDGLAAKVRRLEEKMEKNKTNWIAHMNNHHQEGSDGTVRDGKASILLLSTILVIGLMGIAFATEYLLNVPSEDGTLGIRMDGDGNVEVQALTVTGRAVFSDDVNLGVGSQTLADGSIITNTASFMKINTSGATTTTDTTTAIVAGTATGDLLTIMNVGTNDLVIKNSAHTHMSGDRTMAAGLYSTTSFIWDGTTTNWVCTGESDN